MGCGSSTVYDSVATLHRPVDSRFKELVRMESTTDEGFVLTPVAVVPPDDAIESVAVADPNSQLTPKPKGLKNFGTAKMDLEEVFAELDRRCSELLAAEDYTSADCKDNLLFLREVSFYGRGIPEKKRAVANYLFEKGLVEIFRRIWRRCFALDFLDPNNKRIATNMKYVMVGLWNSSDRSDALCDEVIQLNLHEDIFRYLDDEKLNPKEFNDTSKLYFVKGLLGILHNSVQSCIAAREAYRDCGAVALLRKFRVSSNEMVKLKAGFLLAYIITEEENEEIYADSKNFAFLVSILENALKSPDHQSRKYGFQAVELINGLNKLAVNDGNKVRIVESGAMPYYIQLLQPQCSEKEQEMAAHGIWMLSFKCKDALKKEPGCLEALRLLSESSDTNDTVRKMATGALWILESHIPTEPTRKRKKKKKKAERDEEEISEDVPHVMISYQWDYKPTMVQVKNRLVQAGYKVWIDDDNMSGSLLNAMGLAVDHSVVILVAFSHQYKESPNCRTEAEYAYSSKKSIVPLKVEPKYKPDGWLGALIGNKLYFDFSEPSRFESSMTKLMKELGDRGKKSVNATVTATKVPVLGDAKPSPSGGSGDGGHVEPLPTKLTGVGSWSTDDVGQWLTSNGLAARKNAMADIDGGLLLELQSLLHTAPEFCCSSLKNDLHFSFIDILKFSKAVKQLV